MRGGVKYTRPDICRVGIAEFEKEKGNKKKVRFVKRMKGYAFRHKR